MPNSVACLIEVVASAPAFARAIIFAPELYTGGNADEISAVLSGGRAISTTSPPVALMTRKVLDRAASFMKHN
jgi:hypothetical protein